MTDRARKGSLPLTKGAMELLDLYFLDIRCHLLEAAAAFDRIERAEGSGEAIKDPRFTKLMEALNILGGAGTNRARSFLELFSDPE